MTATQPERVEVTNVGPIGKLFAGQSLAPVTHDQARNAACDLIDHFFKNEPRKGGGVLISVPARPDNTDLVLMRYIEEQRATEQALRAENEGLREALKSARHEMRRSLNNVMGVETDEMGGDNLAVVLCTYFSDRDDSEDDYDDTGWSEYTVNAYETVKSSIEARFAAPERVFDAALAKQGEAP